MLAPVPPYVWTLIALVIGIVSGGSLPETLAVVARGTAFLIEMVVAVVPVLIFVALSPAVASLVRRGRAGRFATAVVLWYGASSTLAGLLAVVISSILFGIPWVSDTGGEPWEGLPAFWGEGGVSWALSAILAAVAFGLLASWVDVLYGWTSRVQRAIAGAGGKLGYVMIPIVFCLGVTIGVNFGARLGTTHYLSMTLYTGMLCVLWWVFYVFVLVRFFGRAPIGEVLTRYYFPTALFAAGSCSSLATLPVNLANAKRVGVRDEVADFVLPFGAVANMDGSALAYTAYAPFVLSHVYGFETSWSFLLAAWPAIVLFTAAAPGLPAGMGTALWSSTLFVSMLGVEEPVRSELIATWIALSGGLPDMFRTATNTTGDGFTAIIFDSWFDRVFARGDSPR